MDIEELDHLQEMSEQTETAAVEQNMAENGTNGATNGGQVCRE